MASQTISSFQPIPGKNPGDAPFAITLPTSSSGLAVKVTVKSGPATISGNTITLTKKAGLVVLAANQPGTPAPTGWIYNFGIGAYTSYTDGSGWVYSGKNWPPGSDSSGGTWTYTGAGGRIPPIPWLQPVPRTAPSYTTAISYDPAPEVTASFSVAFAQQTLSAWGAIPRKRPNSPPFLITIPTSSSGLPVKVYVKSGPAVINGNTITLTGGTGTVVLAAVQDAAAVQSAGFSVTPSGWIWDSNLKMYTAYSPGNGWVYVKDTVTEWPSLRALTSADAWPPTL